MTPRSSQSRLPEPGSFKALTQQGASRALFRTRAPTTAWTRLGVPEGALILGRSTGTGKLNYVPWEMLSMHSLVAGSTGSGKSMFLFNCFMQHVLMLDGVLRGATLIDPHGSLSNLIEEYVVAHDLHKVRTVRVVRIGAGEVVGFDLLPDVPGVDPAVIVDAVVGAVATVWHQNLDEMPRLRQALSAVLYAIKVCKLTLNEAIDLMLVEDRSGLRRYVTERIKHPVFRAYFEDLEALPVAQRKEEFQSTGRRLSEFLKLDIIRLCFGVRSREKLIDFGKIMDEGQILVLDLSTGPHLSMAGSKLLGSLVVNSLFLHALKRTEGAVPHHLFIDEAGQYLTEDAAAILDQARKFGLHFTLCVQTLAQIRERGEKLFGSVMANTRTKIIFGGLDDDDATHLARTCWRGQLNLERSKRSFERMMVTGDELVWLDNESQSQGVSRADGRTWSQGSSQANQQSTSASQSTTRSTSETQSKSETHSNSTTESQAVTHSESVTDSNSVTDSHSVTESESETETENWSMTSGVSEATIESQGESRGKSESYDYEYPTPEVLALAYGRHTSGTSGSSSAEGSSHAESSSNTQGGSTARTRGRAVTDGVAHTRGTANTTGQAETTGTANTTGQSVSHGVARTQGVAETEGRSTSVGTTHTRSQQQGGSLTYGVSESQSHGRGQAYRSVYEKLPTKEYSLEELVHLASVTIGNLPVGTCLAKIGSRRVVRIKCLEVKRRVVSEEHLARVRGEMFRDTPFTLTREEAQEEYDTFRTDLMEQLEPEDDGRDD